MKIAISDKRSGIKTFRNFKFQILNFKLKRSGNAWVGLLMLLIFLITLGLALATDVIGTLVQTKRASDVSAAGALADAGIDRAVWQLNKTGGLYSGENGIPLGSGFIDITVQATANPLNKLIYAKSYIPNKTNPKVMRQARAAVSSVSTGDNVSFHYAVQIGAGGLNMNPNSHIYNTVFTNGSISGAGTIHSDAFAVGTITGVNVTGTKYQGVEPQPMPAIDVAAWKSYSNINNDAITGDLTKTSGSLGPKRINGNCTFENITVTGPIYCTGTIQLSGTISILSSYGSNGTVMMADGMITDSGATITDTGSNPRGYLMVITNSTDPTAAITLSNWSAGGVFLAVNGGVSINPHTHPVIVSAYRFNLQPNSDLTCDAGLGSASFVNGPGGFWQVTEWETCNVANGANTCNL